VALLIHELATNASKYGALSSDRGTVEITVSSESEEGMVEWTERGGPAITGEPTHSGFGTKLADLSVVNQLGGTIEREWRPEGLCAVARIPLKALAR